MNHALRLMALLCLIIPSGTGAQHLRNAAFRIDVHPESSADIASRNSVMTGHVPRVNRRALSCSTSTPRPGYVSRSKGLSEVNDFLYQLQDLDLVAIGNTAFDLVVMDYSSDGTDAGMFTPGEIDALKHGPGGDKIVVSYMSIGEAEDYRFYWQSDWSTGNPAWLGQENPDWPGNYKVHYWDPAWQAVIFSYTDRLLEAGFDGAYLDIIDAYEYHEDRGRDGAAQEMADFVAAIAAHAHTRIADFLIIPQNAAGLAAEVPAYLNAVDGIGQEDIYYGYDSDGIATPADVTDEMERHLDLFRDNGKLVLTVDYPFSDSEDVPHFDPVTMAKIDSAYTRSSANGYVPYCTVRNLNYLVLNPGHEPTGVAQENPATPVDRFWLSQSYPNPFSPGGGKTMSIAYRVGRTDESVSMRLWVFDVLGREIVTLVHGRMPPGDHTAAWDGRDHQGRRVPDGVYFLSMMAGEFTATRRVVLIHEL